jgi:hypothetical protein
MLNVQPQVDPIVANLYPHGGPPADALRKLLTSLCELAYHQGRLAATRQMKDQALLALLMPGGPKQ